MRGEIDFRESFTRRVGLLRGLDVSVMEEIARSLPITEGLERMMTVLKRVGYKTAILSGGFTYFGNYLRQKYGFDYVYANELEIEEGKLTGRYVGEIVDGAARPNSSACSASSRRSTSRSRWLSATGRTTCRCSTSQVSESPSTPNPRSRPRPGRSISTIGLDGILYFLGLKDSRIEE